MDQGGTPEKNQGPSMDQLAKQAVDEIIAKYSSQWEAAAAEASPDKQKEMREEIAKQAKQELAAKIKDLGPKEAQKEGEAKGEEKTVDPKEQAKEAKKTFLEISEMKKHGVELLDKTTQPLVDSLAEKIKTGEISDKEAVDIANTIGKQIMDGVVFSQKGQQQSDFEKNLRDLEQINETAARKVESEFKNDPSKYGLTQEQVQDKFGRLTQPEPASQPDDEAAKQQEALQKMMGGRRGEDPREDQYQYQDRPLYARFTGDDQEFLHQFYKVDSFTDMLKGMRKTFTDHEADKAHGGHIRHEIESVFREVGREVPKGAEMDRLVEKQIGIEVGEAMAKKLTEIMNKLYWQVHNERPHKFFEEIEKEDFMTGIEATRRRIANALESLQHTLEDEEFNKKTDYGIKLYKHGEKEYFIDEKDVFVDGRHVATKPYLRVSPLPEFKEVKLSEYVKSMIKNMDHWRHRSEYLHNGRAIFNHPAHGDKGFYSNLGGYAENLSGTDVDEMMLLPDGQMVFDAYILYDKLVEEEFASQDWKHRPNQFTNSLEEVNTKVEKEVIKRMQKLYGEESLDALQNAVNSAVGMARAVFLTETEKSAYADAVDPTGGGMFASYATNDATALQTFNPLHVMLRWQGEHMLPIFYFMETKGSGSVWNHRKTWDNAQKYLDTFKSGRGDLSGKNLFVEDLVDNMNVGGILKRKGWRLSYALEGHNVYETKVGPDGVARRTNDLDNIETFKAMDVIGYEAVYDYLTTKLDKGLLKAESGSKGAAKMDQLFKYIFDRYFVPMGVTDYKGYMKSLRAAGEARAHGVFKSGETLPAGSWEAQINLETANVFIENALAREVALRFPSKFLKMDRDRFTDNGISRYSQILKDLGQGWTRDRFNEVMRDFSFAELLMRREISGYVKKSTQLFPELGLNSFNKFEYQINEASIRRLLKDKAADSRIEEVVTVWKALQNRYISKSEFMDKKAAADIKKYTFTFGIEDTDFTLMAMRATGPRMIARSINDTGQMESITGWIINMPRLLNQVATSGKKDFTPIIEYLQKAQNAFTSVHGTGADFKYIYRIAAAAIQYFKKDTRAKPLFGLFGLGRRNSIAAEYAGRSSAVWEWDAREIDRFIVSLESLRLLPKEPFNMQHPPKYDQKYIQLPFMKKPVKFGKKQHVDYEWNAARLRKEFGADPVDIAMEWINTILPILGIYVLMKYIKDSLDEASGKKK